MPKGIKKAVKRGLKNAKKELGPLVKGIAREALRAAKNEAKASGLGLISRGMKNVFGSGDYKTNSLIRGGMQSSPSFGPSNSTFRRRECLGEITTSATARAFKIQKFRINPGLVDSFPWLSGLANNYESYKPRSMIFEYIPTSGMSVSSGDTSLGSVTMATQYNPYASDPSNLIQIQGYTNAVAFAPYECAAAGVECVPAKRQADMLLIRNANVANAGGLVLNTGFDTLFDLGEFFIATDGFQAASVVIGQLWVTYDITMSNPIVPISLPFNSGINVASTTSTNNATNVFATPFFVETFGRSFKNTVNDATNHISLPNFPPGQYLVSLFVNWGAPITDPNPTISVTGSGHTAGFSIVAPQTSAVTTQQAIIEQLFLIVDSDTTGFTFGQLGGATNITKYAISIIRVPTDYTLT